MRQHAAWLSTLPLLVAGQLAGHSLGYGLAIPDAHARADALAQSGHGYLGYARVVLTIGLGLLLAALAFRVVATFRGSPSRPPASPAILLLPPVAFVAQEYLERLVHSGQMQWATALQPSFLVGLALQLPIALLALLLAWALESIAEKVGRLLSERKPALTAPVLVPVPTGVVAAARLVGLARGYGERAPPLD